MAQLNAIADALNSSKGNLESLDRAELQKAIFSAPKESQKTVGTMMEFAARGKSVSVDGIERFRLIAEQIKDGKIQELSETLGETADINNLKAPNGQNLLVFALGVGASSEVLNLLLASGIDVNAVDDQGDTAAHRVVRWGGADYIPRLEMLRQNGANFDIKDKNGFSVDDIIARAN